MARPEHEAFKEEAFKFFCPGGVSLTIADSVTFTPEFEDFLSNAKRFMNLRFGGNYWNWMKLSPAIHLSGCGNCRKEEWLVPSNP
jgi:hypothetical protein